MFTLPRSRQWLPPALMLLTLVLFYRSITRLSGSLKAIVRFRSFQQIHGDVKVPKETAEEDFLPLPDPSQAHLWPEQKYYFDYPRPAEGHFNPYLEPLLHCPKPNPYTNHIRLPNIIQNVSQLTNPDVANNEQKFNPTVLALPPWSQHQYLLVSRVVTEGLHQESILCEADSCYSGHGPEGRRPGERDCTAEDVIILGAAGGLRCATPPQIVSIPPTPAERCEGRWSAFPDIPGFHDPRIFWSGKGEPLIMVNSASRYACVGLWITDLRTLHEPLKELLVSQPGKPYHPGPLMSYPSLTELTRNPASTRASVEKNWFLFFPTADEAFLHYDLSIPRVEEGEAGNKTVGGRTLAKLIGNGFTTPNLTDPAEPPCLPDEPDGRGKFGYWHQTSNALKLILCRRAEAERGECSEEQDGRAVHFAVMHRKFSNDWDLPLRYERFFVVWDTRPPFRILAMSRYPVQMWNETASGWSPEENWAGHDDSTSAADDSPSSEAEVIADTTVSSWSAGESQADHNHSHSHNHTHNYTTTKVTNQTQPRCRTTNTTSQPLPQQPRPQTQHQTTNWAYFTYTTSISWAFRSSQSPHEREREREGEAEHGADNADADGYGYDGYDDDDEHTRTLEAMNIGYLDDEVVLGIGVDDQGQGFARARAELLLACLRACPL